MQAFARRLVGPILASASIVSGRGISNALNDFVYSLKLRLEARSFKRSR
jgi:hypothetical protein